MTFFTVEQLREAAEYAPPSGPVAPKLRGVQTSGLKHLVCAHCVGRITARGLGHFLRGVTLWDDDVYGASGDCVVCGKEV